MFQSGFVHGHGTTQLDHRLMRYPSDMKFDYYPLVMTNIAMVFRWPIEIDGLPINSMVDLSMANC